MLRSKLQTSASIFSNSTNRVPAHSWRHQTSASFAGFLLKRLQQLARCGEALASRLPSAVEIRVRPWIKLMPEYPFKAISSSSMLGCKATNSHKCSLIFSICMAGVIRVMATWQAQHAAPVLCDCFPLLCLLLSGFFLPRNQSKAGRAPPQC